MGKFKQKPRNPPGFVHGKDFFDTGDWAGNRIGLITRVDELNMRADVKILTGGGYRLEVDLTQAMAGPRSFWGGVPEVNALCIIGFRRVHKNLNDAVILGYLPVGNRSGLRFDPFAASAPSEVDPDDQEVYEELVGETTRYKRLLMRPGDVGGMSADGSELVLSKDVCMTNRAGDFIELRDTERTLVMQAIHRVQSEGGVRHFSGPARRSAFFLPPDIFVAGDDPYESGTLLKSTDDEYYGRDELENAGPGDRGGTYKFAGTDGEISSIFNDYTEFPPVTYSSGQRVYYPPTHRPDLSIENPDSPADAFTENRMEMSHSTDLVQEVLEQVDGFSIDRRPPYIERVYGTIVGNDMTTSRGQRQYGKVLKPKVFPDFVKHAQGKFSWSEIDRVNQDEADTAAGAFLFRIRPPKGKGDNHFVMAVTKEGKALMNIPASSTDDYASGASNISAECNLRGALKMFLGASTPDRISAHITCEGGVHLDIGRDNQGNVITTNFKGAVRQSYTGNPNEDDAARFIEVKGEDRESITGAKKQTINGSKLTTVNGLNQTHCDRGEENCFSGKSLNCGEYNQLVSGKSQFNYALAVLKNIVAGGEIETILAGGKITTIAAGAYAITTAAGAMTQTVPGGAYTVTVGSGAISATTAAGAVTLSTASGAMTMSAGAGAVAITAGLALNLTAAATVNILGATVILSGGAVPGVLGVSRGLPAMPPGAPSLCYVTGLPVLGAALTLSS
jgi:hypothetical protein